MAVLTMEVQRSGVGWSDVAGSGLSTAFVPSSGKDNPHGLRDPVLGRLGIDWAPGRKP